MNCITSRQINIDLFPHENGFRFQHEGKDKVHAFFQKQPFDTVKLCQDGKRKYLHFIDDEVEVFDSKKALRKTLSRESGGAWIEEKGGKKRFFVDESGWFNTSYKQVSKEEFLQKVDSPSTMQKVLGIGLGILALLPGALEIKERLPFGASEAGLGLLALQQRSPLLGALGYSFLPSSVNAQAVGTEFQVNTYTTNNQHRPTIAPLNDGGFVITWQSNWQDGSFLGIFAQRYDDTGTIVGSELQVNNYTTNSQDQPAIALLNDGGFVVAWRSNGQDGDLDGIFAQRFGTTGAPLGSEFQVNNYTTFDQRYPAVAPLNDGGFVVTWSSNGQDGDSYGIFAQRYNANRTLFGSEFQVNNYTTAYQWRPAVAPLNDGGFVIAWESFGQDGNGHGIFTQRYDATGAIVDSEFQVNGFTTNAQDYPAIAPLNDGGFIVAWQSILQDGDRMGIFAQRYGASGAIVGSEFQVNNYTASDQEYPAIAPLNDGGFVIVWGSNRQDGNLTGIFAQRYDATGATAGSEFQVNSFTINNQQLPVVAPLSDGGFVIVWQSEGQDGDLEGVFGQRYDRNGSPVPLTYVPSMSSASALSSNADTTNLPSSQLSPTSSATTENSALSSSTTPSLSASSTSGVQTTPQTDNSSPSGFGIPVLIEVVYGEIYPIQLNGQTIGTFTISGGTGQYSGSNPNTLSIEIDPDTFLQDGDTVTLFSAPEEEELQWDSVTFVNSDGCFNAEGELVRNEENNGRDYQVIFSYEGESCSIYGGASKFGAIPVLTSGGLI